MRVLIVEDEMLIAMDLEAVLSGLGHDVCALATTVEQALAAAAEHRPHIALMDLRLADGASGIDAARRLRAEHGIRCIVLSASLDEATKDQLLPLAPVAFVSKPVLLPMLTAALRRAQHELDVA